MGDDHIAWTDSKGRESLWQLVRPPSQCPHDFPWLPLIKAAAIGFRGRKLHFKEIPDYVRDWVNHDASLRDLVDPPQDGFCYTQSLKKGADFYSWVADCFNAAMQYLQELGEGRRAEKKCWIQVNNTEYVGMFEIMKISPELLHGPQETNPEKVGNLLEIMQGRSIAESRLELLHSIWAVSYTHLTLPTICSV